MAPIAVETLASSMASGTPCPTPLENNSGLLLKILELFALLLFPFILVGYIFGRRSLINALHRMPAHELVSLFQLFPFLSTRHKERWPLKSFLSTISKPEKASQYCTNWQIHGTNLIISIKKWQRDMEVTKIRESSTSGYRSRTTERLRREPLPSWWIGAKYYCMAELQEEIAYRIFQQHLGAS